MDLSLEREKAFKEKAQRIGDVVELLTPYLKRKVKLDANFNLAPNKADAMSNWLACEWIPQQPDSKLLNELSKLVGLLDFVGFVFHGVSYWDRLEAVRNIVKPGIERV